MKFISAVIRHCISNIGATMAADSNTKPPYPGSNGLVQNGYISQDSRDKEGYEEQRMMKAKQMKKQLVTRRRRRCSTLSASDEGSESDGDAQDRVFDDRDLSEGELDELWNETVRDGDEER